MSAHLAPASPAVRLGGQLAPSCFTAAPADAAMAPRFPAGGLLLFDPGEPLRNGAAALVQIRSGPALLRFVTRTDGGYRLTAADPAVRPLEVTLGAVRFAVPAVAALASLATSAEAEGRAGA